jgi:nitrogen regulatory protein PII 2
MKEIIAIIRDERVEATKSALEEAGVSGITFVPVVGRGSQRGRIRTTDNDCTLMREAGIYLMQQRGMISDSDAPRLMTPVEREIELGFLQKRMLMLVVNDKTAPIVSEIVRVNKSGRKGDGKIFVCPVTDALRIRTGERGDPALS